eukprot:sb/3476370/
MVVLLIEVDLCDVARPCLILGIEDTSHSVRSPAGRPSRVLARGYFVTKFDTQYYSRRYRYRNQKRGTPRETSSFLYPSEPCRLSPSIPRKPWNSKTQTFQVFNKTLCDLNNNNMLAKY